VEEEKKQGTTSPVLYSITVTLAVNVNYPNYKDILWINYMYDNYALN